MSDLVFNTVEALPRTECAYGAIVNGVRIGAGAGRCQRPSCSVADKELHLLGERDIASLYRCLRFCKEHQVREHDLSIALSGMLDLADNGTLVSRMVSDEPVILPEGTSLDDVAPLVHVMMKNVVHIDAPTAEEVLRHMTVEGADEWMNGALERLATLGFLVRVDSEPLRYRPTDYGRLCINTSRDELLAAGVIAR